MAADVLRARAGGLPGEGLAGGREAAPKGAGLLELDERGAAQPLEQLRIGARSSAGGAELLDPVPLRSTSSGLGPLDQHPRCLVAPLTSAHNYPATTLQRRQTLRPEFPADCPVVSSLRLASLSTRTNEKFSDACDLRLLGLRTTLEVLKQLPVILEAKSVDEGD